MKSDTDRSTSGGQQVPPWGPCAVILDDGRTSSHMMVKDTTIDEMERIIKDGLDRAGARLQATETCAVCGQPLGHAAV